MNRMQKYGKSDRFISQGLFLFVLLLFAQCAPNKPRFEASKTRVFVPDSVVEFSEYIEKNHQHVLTSLGRRFANNTYPFGLEFPLDRVVEHISSPFERAPVCHHNEQPVGILILHGLFSTPGGMRTLANSLHEHIPCSLIRTTLMAGHGSVPADALETRFQEWQQMTAYAVSSFNDRVKDLFLIGYSTGGSLALDYVQNPHRFASFSQAPKISGVVFLSPAFFLPKYDRFSSLFRSLFPYVIIGHDDSPYSYESRPMNLAVQVYKLSHVPDYTKKMTIPVSMVLSADDSVVDFEQVNTYFCQAFSEKNRRLLVYPGMNTDIQECKGVDVHEPLVWPNEWRMRNFSHESLHHPVDHPYFGFDVPGHKNCNLYGWSAKEKEECESQIDSIEYGAMNLIFHPEIRKGDWLRLATFNPFYDSMISDFVLFIQKYRVSATNDQKEYRAPAPQEDQYLPLNRSGNR